MNEATASEPAAWFLKYGSSDAESDEIQQLSESELQRALRKAGDKLGDMFVKQGNSDWYPAKFVLKKFERLANEGIYIRCEGIVDGPFTAVRALQMLSEIDIDDTQAKVGIHADWVHARRLLKVLRKNSRPAEEGASNEEDSADSEGDDDDDVLIDAELDDDIIDAQVIDEQPLIELVMVAEPVALPQKPPAPVEIIPQPRSSARKSSARKSSSRENQSTIRPTTNGGRRGKLVLLGAAGLIGLLTLAAGVVWIVMGGAASEPVAGSNETGVAELTTTQYVPVEPRTSPAPAPAEQPPEVRPGTLYRPSIQTTMGEVTKGVLFAARVGRSNRTVLVGAANLLGPNYGLTRQLRGAEVSLHFQGLQITDYVTNKTRSFSGKPVRLRTSEYPSISVHGDVLIFEPDDASGIDPLPIVSKLPNIGDRVWLLGRATEGDSLVHGGRFQGTQGDWLQIRLDDQALDLSSASGGAVLNAQHDVIGIRVARDQTGSGTITIASPIKLIIPEIQ